MRTKKFERSREARELKVEARLGPEGVESKPRRYLSVSIAP